MVCKFVLGKAQGVSRTSRTSSNASPLGLNWIGTQSARPKHPTQNRSHPAYWLMGLRPSKIQPDIFAGVSATLPSVSRVSLRIKDSQSVASREKREPPTEEAFLTREPVLGFTQLLQLWRSERHWHCITLSTSVMVLLLRSAEQHKRDLLFGHSVSVLAIGNPKLGIFLLIRNSSIEKDLLTREHT